MITRLSYPAFWLAVAFTLVMALLPKPPSLPLAPVDKFQHMAAFATLALLAAVTFGRRRYRVIFMALAGFGALIEVLQLIPALHRAAELADWIADCAAVLAVLAACRLVGLLYGRGATDIP